MREPSRHCVWSRRAAVRAGEGLRQSSGVDGDRRYTGSVLSTKLKVTGNRPVLRRRFHRRRRHRGNRVVRSVGRRLQEARHQGRPARWAPACTAIPPTVRGTSNCCAKGASSATCATTSCSVNPAAAIRARKARAARASMADSDEVCGCNGVCKGTIVKAIKEKRPVHAGRGQEAHQGIELMRFVYGARPNRFSSARWDRIFRKRRRPRRSAAAPTTRTATCARRFSSTGCSRIARSTTSWRGARRTDARRAVRAINYYLLSTWPREAVDDPQSRFVNERVHGQHTEGQHVLGDSADEGAA